MTLAVKVALNPNTTNQPVEGGGGGGGEREGGEEREFVDTLPV